MAQQAVDLDALLAACLGFDNQARKQAEKALKQLSAHPQYVPELCRRLEAGDAQVRQLAAVMVRKAIAKLYPKLLAEVQGQVRALLLQRVIGEPLHSVRRAIADVAAAVARIAVPDNQWPELLQFLQQCSSSGVAEHREVAMLLFASLMETLGDFMAPHVGGVMSAVTAALSDASPAVRTAALQAVEPLLPLVATQDQLRAFHTLVGAMLAAAERGLAAAAAQGASGAASNTQEEIILICQALLEAAEFPAPLLQPALPSVLEMSLAVAGARALEADTREQALQLLHWVARFKPKQLSKQKPLLKRAVEALCVMMCEPLPDDYDDASELPPQRMAAQALDLLALHLPGNQVLPAVWQFCGAASQSPDPNQRHAAALALTVVAEGCADPLRKRLPEVLALLLALLRDPQENVRGAAAFAIGQMAEYVQPEVLEHHAQILPALLELLNAGAPTPDLLERLVYAVDAFVENMADDVVAPYMPALMQLLGAVLSGQNTSAHKEALSCLASVVAAAGKGFAPFAPTVLPVLQHFMSLPPSPDTLPARCKAIECAGMLADSLGPSDPTVGPAIPGIIEAVLAGFASVDSPELREYSHLALANLAGALKDGFAPFVARCVALAAASCDQSDGDFVRGGEGDDGAGSEDLGSEDSGADDDEDDSDDGSEGGGGNRGFRVRSGVMDEKVAATHAVGAFADACAGAVLPHAEQLAGLLKASAQHLHEEVRSAAHEALPKLVLAVHRATSGGPAAASDAAAAAAAAGGTTAPPAVSPQTRAVAGGAAALLLDPLETDPDKPAVTSAVAGLAQLLEALGAAAFEQQQLEAMAKAAADVLKGEAACQQEEEDDEDGGYDDGDDAGDEDEDLISAAADLLPALAAAVGPAAYAPVFLQAHLGPLLARLKPQQPPGVRGIAAGALAEVCEKLGVLAAPAAEQALPLLIRELRSEDPVNRQNAAFACGIIAHTCPQQAAPHAGPLLQALHPLFGPEEEVGARDNAAGAVGRMVLAMGPSLPVEQIVPVLAGALPLKEDLEETAPAVAALSQLLTGEATAQRVAPHAPAVVQAFGRIAVQEAAPMGARVQAARALAQLQAQGNAAVAQLCGALPADQQQALQQLASS